jgi:hypothetical protein
MAGHRRPPWPLLHRALGPAHPTARAAPLIRRSGPLLANKGGSFFGSAEVESAKTAKRRLEQLARGLEDQHPSAARSLREGLEETLTLQRLGIRGALWKTLRSTNPIENLNSAIAKFTRNVKRWKGGSMILRWVGSAVLEAESHFHHVKGYDQMPDLIRALRPTQPSALLAEREEAA